MKNKYFPMQEISDMKGRNENIEILELYGWDE
jgi:hypothetical protein